LPSGGSGGSVADLPTGPKQAASTVLTIDEEATIVAFRRHTLLPLDDCFYALQATIPHLTRSSLHRCLQHLVNLELRPAVWPGQPMKRITDHSPDRAVALRLQRSIRHSG